LEWEFSKDKRLLFFPLAVVFIFIGLAILGHYSFWFNFLTIAWSFGFLFYFYRLHIKRDLSNSIKKLRYQKECFQIFDKQQWIKVELAKSAFISSWLMALQWKVSNKEKPFLRQTYSLIIFPSSLTQNEFRSLVRMLK